MGAQWNKLFHGPWTNGGSSRPSLDLAPRRRRMSIRGGRQFSLRVPNQRRVPRATRRRFRKQRQTEGPVLQQSAKTLHDLRSENETRRVVRFVRDASAREAVMKRSLLSRWVVRSYAGPLCGILSILVGAVQAHATDASTCLEICPGTGACTINALKNIEPGAELDCSGRDITLTGNGALKVTDGQFSLLANNLTVDGPGGTIYAVEGTAHEPGEIDIDLTGNLWLAGKIRANGNSGGGSITVDADGNITIPDSGDDGVEAGGTASGASGGTIELSAGGTMTISDPIHAEGADAGQESAGGTVDLDAKGDITINADGHIAVPGHLAGGGTITITSEDGSIVLNEHADADGNGSVGDGGRISLSAGNGIQIVQGFYVRARGGVNANGGEAQGGAIDIEAGCGGVSINSPFMTTGGLLGSGYDAGRITVSSLGNISLASGVTLDAHALGSGGSGGAITLRAGDLVSIPGSATLDARGSSTAGGEGGRVTLSGCRVSVASGAILDVTGDKGGTIALGATLPPPATGTQPLVASSAASYRATGSSAASNGRITLAPLTLRAGECTNDGTRTCLLDTDCTVGCQTGDCLYANPDTDGQNTGFTVTPERIGNQSLGQCFDSCGGY